MSYRENVVIIKAACLADGVFEMWFKTENIAKAAKPGQFISVYSNDGSRLLPRPISICRIENDLLRIVYRVAGKGTLEFSQMKEGERLNIQGPLGNGYDLKAIFEQVEKTAGNKPEKAILFGGGIGVPPMLELAKAVSEQTSCKVQAVMGYRDSQMFLKDEFEAYAEVTVATEDGSAGVKGNVLDAVKECGITGDVIFACGPAPMLRAIKSYSEEQGIEAYISLEEKMACGIGACLACVCQSKDKDEHSQVHNKRVCKEGPVFNAKEVEI